MLKTLNYSLIFLAILVVRAFVKGANVGDAVSIAALASLYGYGLYLNTIKHIKVNDNIIRDVEILKSSVDGLKVARSFTRT